MLCGAGMCQSRETGEGERERETSYYLLLESRYALVALGLVWDWDWDWDGESVCFRVARRHQHIHANGIFTPFKAALRCATNADPGRIESALAGSRVLGIGSSVQ